MTTTRKYTEEQRSEAVLFANQHSTKEAAQHFGIPSVTIDYWKKRQMKMKNAQAIASKNQGANNRTNLITTDFVNTLSTMTGAEILEQLAFLAAFRKITNK